MAHPTEKAIGHPEALSPSSPPPPYGAENGPKAAFTVPEHQTLGDDAPPVSLDDYTVHIQMIPSKDGPPLLLETAKQVRSRYAFYRNQEGAKYAAEPELRAIREVAVDAERDGFISAMQNVADKHGHLARQFWFKFRVPTVYDVEESEAQTLAPRTPPVVSSTPAGMGGQLLARVEDPVDPEARFPVRARSRFRRHLAARTLIAWEFPNFMEGPATGSGDPKFEAFSHLPNAVHEVLMVEVARRISFETDALAFLESWEPAS